MRGIYRYLTVEEVSQPRAGMVCVIRDSWWRTDSEGRVAMYLLREGGEEHPQCNTNKAIVDRPWPDGDPLTGQPVFIPLAFSNHRCEQ